MKISIITVCFNSERTIADTINSVCQQTYPDIEYLIIDGQSTDGTLGIIQSHVKFNCIDTLISEHDSGIYDAMNKGISMASGDVIGLLNADDVYVDETILKQVADIFSNQDIDACYADLVYVDQLDGVKIIRYWKSSNYSSGMFERGWMPAHPTFFVRRNVYERFGKFDLSFQRQADFELTLRFLCVNKIRSIYIPRIWVKMRLGGISNRGLLGVISANLEAYRACKKHALKIPLAPLFISRKLISRIPQFFLRPK